MRLYRADLPIGLFIKESSSLKLRSSLLRRSRAISRLSASKAYLHPAEKRPNLTVRTSSLVTKVIIEGGRARGVEVVKVNQLGLVRPGRAERIDARVECHHAADLDAARVCREPRRGPHRSGTVAEDDETGPVTPPWALEALEALNAFQDRT